MEMMNTVNNNANDIANLKAESNTFVKHTMRVLGKKYDGNKELRSENAIIGQQIHLLESPQSVSPRLPCKEFPEKSSPVKV